MAPNIPEKQWAQVIEKTGGPIDYKQIDGKDIQPSIYKHSTDTLQSRNQAQMKCLSTSNTLVSATLISTLSTEIGHCQPSFH